jgi:hypothetical protein
MIKYAQRSVLLTTPSRERIEYEGIQPAPEEYENDLMEGVYTENSKVGCEFSDVHIEEQTPLEELNITNDYAYDDYPVRILETAQRTLKGRVLKVCKIQWSNQTEEDAAWKNEDQMKIDFPHLFEV